MRSNILKLTPLYYLNKLNIPRFNSLSSILHTNIVWNPQKTIILLITYLVIKVNVTY